MKNDITQQVNENSWALSSNYLRWHHIFSTAPRSSYRELSAVDHTAYLGMPDWYMRLL